MPHFVTSAQGKAHVTSANAAHLTAGLLGNGCYVLPIGSKLACTMTDSNTLRVLFGVASVCGRQWEIEGDYEEVNIDNGVPGYNRTDLLVCRIETAPQETIELKVYKGDETTGTPVVPGHVEGDLNDGDTVCEMPICSVRVNGINPQAPEMLAKESIDIMALLQELRDYKSQMQTAGGINVGGVAGAKLADLAVTEAKLAAGAVTSAKIKDGSIVSADIAAGTIAEDRLASAVRAKFRAPALLWSGTLLMQSGHTANLSQKVSAQPHGIMLVFSSYNGSTGVANDYGFTSFFVSSAVVAAYPGKGHWFHALATDAAAMAKYIYIADDKLTGYSGNNGSGTSGGVQYNNLAWVLRRVYGV